MDMPRPGRAASWPINWIKTITQVLGVGGKAKRIDGRVTTNRPNGYELLQLSAASLKYINKRMSTPDVGINLMDMPITELCSLSYDTSWSLRLLALAVDQKMTRGCEVDAWPSTSAAEYMP
eukprot:scaffold188382_cov21-Prasinocladus_malaysianus.AAC.2